MKEVNYFSHDCNARNDLKCAALIDDHGIEAYGIYWVLLEMMREQDGYTLPWNYMTFSGIAKAVGKSGQSTFIQTLILEMCDENKYNLFKKDDQKFWSESLIARMELMTEKLGKFSKAGKASAEARSGKIGIINKEKLKKDAKLKEGCLNILNIKPKLYDEKLSQWIVKEEKLDSLTRPYPEVKRHFYNTLILELNGGAGKNGSNKSEEAEFIIPKRS